MKSLNEIFQKLKEIKPKLETDYNVSALGIFGSFTRGEQQESSDVDILVDFKEEGIGLFQFMDMEMLLQNTLEIKVDLVCKDGLKPRIGKQILNEVIYI